MRHTRYFGPLLVTFVGLVVCGCRSESKPVAASKPAAASEPAAAIKPVERDPRYPAHWWEPVAKDGAPGWEILPQEAGPGELILSKRNELGVLSNFAETPFEFRGQRYASMEGFWQSMKFPEGPDDERATFSGLEWPHTRDEVAQLTGFEAKRAGDMASENMEQMGIDWVTLDGQQIEYRPVEPGEHYELIVAATREKVRQNSEVERVLLSTGELVLKPDHYQPRDATPAWHYHEILMKIRGELPEQPRPTERIAP